MQNTNASAFRATTPTKYDNIGGLVEEHIRYWQKYKDAKEAQGLANELRVGELNRKRQADLDKQNKDNITTFKGLSDIDAVGYFKEQIIKYKKENSAKWLELSKKVNLGNQDAILLYGEEKEKLKNLVNASTIIQNKQQELAKQVAKGEYNQYIDKDTISLNDKITKSKYVLDPKQGKFRFYNDDGTKVVLEVDPLNLTNDFTSTQFHKAPTFGKNAKDIAKDILDKNDGQQLTDTSTKEKGIKRTLTYFNDNDNDAFSWYLKKKEDGVVMKPFIELDINDKMLLADSFYEENVKSNIQETTKDTTIDDAIKRQRLRNAQLDGKSKQLTIKSKKEESKKISNLKLITDGSGNKVGVSNTFTVAFNKPIKLGNVVYDSAIINDKNQIGLNGFSNATLDEDGVIVKEKGYFAKTTTNLDEIGKVIGQLKGVKNSGDLVKQARELLNNGNKTGRLDNLNL